MARVAVKECNPMPEGKWKFVQNVEWSDGKFKIYDSVDDE